MDLFNSCFTLETKLLSSFICLCFIFSNCSCEQLQAPCCADDSLQEIKGGAGAREGEGSNGEGRKRKRGTTAARKKTERKFYFYFQNAIRHSLPVGKLSKLTKISRQLKYLPCLTSEHLMPAETFARVCMRVRAWVRACVLVICYKAHLSSWSGEAWYATTVVLLYKTVTATL